MTSAPVTMSVTGRLLQTRGLWLALGLTSLAAVFSGAAVREAVRMRRVALPGVEWDGGRVVASARPDFLPGDELHGVAGAHGDPYRLAVLLTEVPAGDSVRLELTRGHKRVTVDVPTAPLPELHVAALWVRVVCGLLCLLLGIMSFILSPGGRTAWLFLVFCVSLNALLVFNVALVRFPGAFARVQPMAFALSSAIGLHLFLELPRRLSMLARWPWAAALPYVVAAPFVVGPLLAPLPPLSRTWRLLGLGSELWSVVSGVCTLTILIRGLRKARGDEPLRSSYATLILGVSIGLFVPGLVHSARAVFAFGLEKWVVHVNAAPVAVYAAATAWALLRQNVLGADRVTTQVVSYTATLLLVGAGCGVVLVGVPILVQGSIVTSPLALVATTALASLSVVPIYRRLKRGVDRRFMRDKVSDERIAEELREVMRLAMLGDPARTLSGAFAALAVLTPERIELWMREGGGFHRRRGGDRDQPAPAVAVDSSLGQAVVGERIGGVEGLCSAPLVPDAQAELWSRGLALVAPVIAHGDVRAFVALGRRSSGARYRAGEESFLSMVAAQIGLALERDEAGTSLGKYRLEKRLGMGGMAEVYLARQVGLAGFERRVALKRPLPHLAEDPAFLGMFIDEAKLAAQLRHPNIVQTYEVDRHEGSYYIAMEYVEGASLRTLLRASRAISEPPPLPVALGIIDALLAALAFAHAAADTRGRKLGIVHRDVSPGNVLIGVNGEVKLADFGVARSATKLSVTQTGIIKGTLAYMSPEQAAGKKVDARSDLFSVGAVLYESLMACPPYPDGPPHEAPLEPPPVGGDVPPAIGDVLRRALSYEVDGRFASAEDMRAALRAGGPAAATTADIAAWQRDLLSRAVTVDEPALHEASTLHDLGTRV